MDISITNEKLLSRLEVLRIAVFGADKVIETWVDKKDENEFSGLLYAFTELEEELSSYLRYADPLAAAHYRNGYEYPSGNLRKHVD